MIGYITAGLDSTYNALVDRSKTHLVYLSPMSQIKLTPLTCARPSSPTSTTTVVHSSRRPTLALVEGPPLAVALLTAITVATTAVATGIVMTGAVMTGVMIGAMIDVMMNRVVMTGAGAMMTGAGAVMTSVVMSRAMMIGAMIGAAMIGIAMSRAVMSGRRRGRDRTPTPFADVRCQICKIYGHPASQ
jgi:hypothetical protein